MKKVGVTGASGFIGRALVAALVERGDSVRAFVRNHASLGASHKPKSAADLASRFPREVDVRRLDLAYGKIADIATAIAGLDALIHLSGETVAGRWSEEKKKDPRFAGTDDAKSCHGHVGMSRATAGSFERVG